MPRSPAAIQADIDQARAQGATAERIRQLETELANANQAQLESGDRAGVRAREARAAATDGQTLAGQSADVRASYRAIHGYRAAEQWAIDHEREIGAGGTGQREGHNQPSTPPSTGATTGTTTTTTGGAASDIPHWAAEIARQMQEQADAQAEQRRWQQKFEAAFRDANLALQSSQAASDIFSRFGNPHITPWLQAGRNDRIPLNPNVGRILQGQRLGGATGTVPGDPVYLTPDQATRELIQDFTRRLGARQFNVLSTNPDDRGQFSALAQLAGLDPHSLIQGLASRLPSQARLGQTLFQPVG